MTTNLLHTRKTRRKKGLGRLPTALGPNHTPSAPNRARERWAEEIGRAPIQQPVTTTNAVLITEILPQDFIKELQIGPQKEVPA